MTSENTNNILELFPAEMRDCINELVNTEFKAPSFLLDKIKIKNIKSSNASRRDIDEHADRFVLCLPYVNDILEWTIIFEENNLEMGPDFQFDDDEFLGNPDMDEIVTNVPSWNDWDVNNSKSLRNIIRDLYLLHKKYQVKLLERTTNSRFSFEYLSLVENVIKPENIDVLVRGDTVSFLVTLDITVPLLPPIEESTLDPFPDMNVLFVKFNKQNNVISKLYLSPNIENALGDITQLKMPEFLNSQCLMDYVPLITKWLQDKLEIISNQYKKCREYVSVILLTYKKNVIEYDAVNFNKVVLLFEDDKFMWLLHIHLSKKFPEDKPKYLIFSVNQMEHGQPISQNIDYTYNSCWKVKTMINKAMSEVASKIEAFKTYAFNRST